MGVGFVLVLAEGFLSLGLEVFDELTIFMNLSLELLLKEVFGFYKVVILFLEFAN